MNIPLQLGANRRVYRMLAGAAGGGSAKGAAPDEVGIMMRPFQESGGMDDREFALRVQEMEWDNAEHSFAGQPELTTRQQPVRYALDGPTPLIDDKIAVEKTPPPLPRWQQAEAEPAVGGAVMSLEQDDLLDNLLRRLETNARRYPQDLTGKE